MIIIYAPNLVPKYIKQILMAIQGEVDSKTIIIGDANSPLTSVDKSSGQKINKETMVLNVTLDEIGLIDIIVIMHYNKCYERKVHAASDFIISKPILDQGFKNGLSE